MKRITQIRTSHWMALAVVAGFAVAAATRAEESPARTLGQAPEPGSHVWEFGPEVFNYYYEEPGQMEYEGIMFGLYGRITYHLRGRQTDSEGEEAADTPPAPPSPWVFRADARIAYGSTDYDGRLQDGTPYTMSGVDALSVEGRLLLGHRFESTSGMTTVYGGLGSRYKEDDSSFDRAGYKRESRYLYLPISVEYIHTLPRNRAVIFSAEYTHLISGEQKSDLSGFGIGEITNEQKSGYGLRGAVAYAHPWRNGHVVIEAFIRHWDIDDSEIETVFGRTPRGIARAQFLEPENQTVEAGLSLRYRF